jgi:zinc protease
MADMTVFHSQVPANHLEPLLWAEAERMANLDVSQASLDSEREVVKEELRQRVLADPYGPLFHALPGLGYQQHPYRRAVIGELAELEAATLDEVRAFHARHYRPDNAVLVVAGRFDASQLDRWVDHYFGSIPAGREPLSAVAASEPRLERDSVHRLSAPRGAQAAAALLWQGPPAAHADGAALRLAAALLGQGETARFADRLSYRQRLAQSTGFELMLNAEAGLIVAHAIGADGARSSPEALAGALYREIQRLAQEPLPPRELAKARAQLLVQALAARETAEGRALVLGESLLLRGDALAADAELAATQRMGAAEVQRAVQRWLLQVPRVGVLYEPRRTGAGT